MDQLNRSNISAEGVNRPLKICHLLWGLEVGGIETMLVNIANLQAGSGHDVHIVVVDDAIDEKLVRMLDQKVSVHRIGRHPGSRSIVPIIRLNVIMGSILPDIVHFHNLKLQRLVLPMLYKRCCSTCHSVALDELLPFIPKIKNLFAISEGVRADIKRRTGKESIVVMNGLLTDQYDCRSDLGQTHHPLRIVQIGRVKFSIKGQDITVRAIEKLRDSGYDCVIDFIGDGPDMMTLADLINEAGLTDKVQRLGLKDQEYIRRNLCKYDLLVQPSRHEGFGLTIAEGMSAGVAVLVSDVEAQREVVGNGRFGRLFRSDDPESMACEIRKIIENGIDKRMEKEAKAHAAEHYDVSRTVEEYVRHYYRILASNK